jgi:hypothetical protein
MAKPPPSAAASRPPRKPATERARSAVPLTQFKKLLKYFRDFGICRRKIIEQTFQAKITTAEIKGIGLVILEWIIQDTEIQSPVMGKILERMKKEGFCEKFTNKYEETFRSLIKQNASDDLQLMETLHFLNCPGQNVRQLAGGLVVGTAPKPMPLKNWKAKDDQALMARVSEKDVWHYQVEGVAGKALLQRLTVLINGLKALFMHFQNASQET